MQSFPGTIAQFLSPIFFFYLIGVVNLVLIKPKNRQFLGLHMGVVA
jgi:hypothetical protein